MNRFSVAVRCCLGLLAVGVIASCADDDLQQRLTDPGRSIIPQASDSISLADANATGDAQVVAEESQPEVNVRLPDTYSPARVINVNLDLTDTEEQLVVFKRTDDQTDAIRLLVLTFDRVRNNWIRAWEGETAATNVRSFTVYTDDLIGDHEMELVCFGMNAEGEQTLDVFRRVSSALGLGLSYERIVSIAANVSIEILEIARSDAYENLQATSGTSYPIVVRRRDPESDDVFDLVQTTYYWRFDEGSYVAGDETYIPSAEIQDTRLRDLYAGTPTEFEGFLDGPWFRQDEGELQLVSFSVSERSIVFFYGGHLQQVFRWVDSSKAVYGRDLQILGTNAGIQSISRPMIIRAETLNRIRVSVQGTSDLSGIYERLSPELQQTVISGRTGAAVLSQIELTGPYRSDDGVELAFGDPEFTMRSSPVTGNGGYALYEIGEVTVLELQFLDVNRLPLESRSFRVEYSEERSGDRMVRTLVLEPGSIRIDGFVPSGEPPLRLEQIQAAQEDAAGQ